MIKDILEEAWIRNFSRPELFIFKIIIFILVMLLIGASGWGWVYVFIFMAAIPMLLNIEHINYLLPMSDSYRIKSGVTKVIIKAFMYTLMLVLGTVLSILLFHRNIYGDNIFVILIHIYAFIIFIDAGISMEWGILQGNIKASHKKISDKIIPSFIQGIAIIYVALCALQLFMDGRIFMFNLNLDFTVSVKDMVISTVIMIFVILKIINECRSFDIGDYDDDMQLQEKNSLDTGN